MRAGGVDDFKLGADADEAGAESDSLLNRLTLTTLRSMAMHVAPRTSTRLLMRLGAVCGSSEPAGRTMRMTNRRARGASD